MNPALTLTFIGPERTDARSVKRIAALTDHRWHVLGFTFHRDCGQPDPAPTWENIHLGNTYNRRYLQRAWAVFRGFWRIFRNRKHIATCACLYAINADNALLALFARFVTGRPIPLVMEIADIQPAMTGGRIRARGLRALERFVLRRCQLLLTTSPGFLRNYFEPVQGYRGPVFLMENKIYPAAPLIMSRVPRRSPAQSGRPWVVGYFGAFRCRRSLDLICSLAEALPERVAFILRGVPGGIDGDLIREVIRPYPNIHFGGPYLYPDELPALYAGVDLNWCFDFSASGANSAWLLPNRVYEGGLFHCPALAYAGTETARWVETNGCGAIFREDLFQRLHEFLASLTPADWHAMRDRCAAMPDELCAGEGDYDSFNAALLQLAVESQ
jgi:succinoglycan biosynthesis protein ExoL